MNNNYMKVLGLILAISILTLSTGCSLTKKRIVEKVEKKVEYEDEETDDPIDERPDGAVNGEKTDTEDKDVDDSNNEDSNTPEPVENKDTDKTNNENPTDKNDTDKNKDGGKTDDDKTEKKLTGTLELQIFIGGYGSAAWEYAINEFQKVQPDLEINAHLDTNVNAQMRTRWSKDKPPDFVFLEGTNMPKETWMKEGKLKDLSNLYSSGKVYGTNILIKDQLKDGLVTKYPNSNKIYEMPILLSTYGMWYDQTLFTQKGWTVPKNFNELKTFSAQAKQSGINPIIYTGQYSGYLVWGLLMPAVASEALASGDIQYFYDVANASRESVFSDQRFRNALNKLDQLAEAGYFDMNGLSMNHITSQAAWLQRGSALIPNGLWLENEMKDSTPKDFKMRYYPAMLQESNHPTCIIASSSTVGIATKAKNAEAAETFLRFLYTDDIAKKFTELSGVPSATRTDVSKADITESAKQVNQMINSSSVNVVAKGSTTWGTVDATINDCVNQIVARKYTVDDAIEELMKATKKKNSR